MKILANDGIDAAGKAALEEQGFQVVTTKVPQEDLINAINRENYIGLLVRSATTARKDLIDACPGLRFIGRGGVGIDNIDAEYARGKGVQVFNTPGSSSQSVAELVMALLFSTVRSTFHAGGEMPLKGHTDFEAIKKKYSKGSELRGKTLGIVGFGKIGQSLAAYALGCGMKVIANDNSQASKKVPVELSIAGYDGKIKVDIEIVSLGDLLKQSDFVSLHVPKQPNGAAVIGAEQLLMMKYGSVIINSARGGVVDEVALLNALNSGHIRAAALDVFVGEPKPNPDLLHHPGVIATPHIGASTSEAQERIGLEIAENVKRIMSAQK